MPACLPACLPASFELWPVLRRASHATTGKKMHLKNQNKYKKRCLAAPRYTLPFDRSFHVVGVCVCADNNLSFSVRTYTNNNIIIRIFSKPYGIWLFVCIALALIPGLWSGVAVAFPTWLCHPIGERVPNDTSLLLLVHLMGAAYLSSYSPFGFFYDVRIDNKNTRKNPTLNIFKQVELTHQIGRKIFNRFVMAGVHTLKL